jgi:gliding motility-associated-like protein
MQMLYQRDELMSAGIKAGFINSIAFNIPAKNTSDSFYSFTVKMACTPDASMTGSSMTTYPGTSIVLPPRSLYTTTGWNTIVFPNAYYWDGASNLMIEICWSKASGTYGGSPDPVFSSNTSYTSVKYIPSYVTPTPTMGDGCSLAAATPLLASTRPNVRFNVCVTPSLFKYSWTPTSYLNQPDSANTNVDGIKNDINYNIRVVAASNPKCFSTGVVPITVDRTNSVTALPLSPVIHCRPGYFYDLDAVGSGPKPLRNLPCGISNVLTCGTLSTNVIANPGTSSTVGEPNNHAFNGNYTTAHTQYIIPNSTLRNGSITSGTIRTIAIDAAAASGMNFTNFKIGMKCTNTKQFSSSAPVSFESGVIPVYSSAGETFSASGYKVFTLTTPYNWDTAQNLLIDFCYSQATAATGPTINCYPTPGFNLMVRSHQFSGDICSNPTTEIGPSTFEMLPTFQIGFCSAGDTDFTYQWSPGDYFEDSLMQKPLVYIGSDTKLFVSTRGKSGCLVKDSITIIVPKNNRFVTQDTTICLNESIQLRSYNGTKTKWYQATVGGSKYDVAKTLTCDTCERTIAKPTQSTDYYAAVTDGNGCVDTFGIHVTVKPLPIINITNNDMVLKYGKSAVLNVFGGTQYFWTPMAGISNPNHVSPTVQPMVTTTYHVVGVGMNGCRGEDSVKVTIDYKSAMGVPSAFTPNGDGKNDKFRLIGVTFQTLTEFRVFTRWGQEVFSTQDINDGWDGTFKGKAMDMGSYQYLIRVAYPDGAAETFKGDVTLIR